MADITSRKSKYDGETRNLILSEVKERVDMQFKSVDSLDTKAGIILGFGGVILGILLQKTPSSEIAAFSYGLFLHSLGLFLISMIFAFYAYRTIAYRRDPDPENLAENYLDKKNEVVKKQLIANYNASFKKNEPIIKKKGDYINLSLQFLLAGMVLLSVLGACNYG